MVGLETSTSYFPASTASNSLCATSHLRREVVAAVGMLEAQALCVTVQLEDRPGGGTDQCGAYSARLRRGFFSVSSSSSPGSSASWPFLRTYQSATPPRTRSRPRPRMSQTQRRLGPPAGSFFSATGVCVGDEGTGGVIGGEATIGVVGLGEGFSTGGDVIGFGKSLGCGDGSTFGCGSTL